MCALCSGVNLGCPTPFTQMVQKWPFWARALNVKMFPFALKTILTSFSLLNNRGGDKVQITPRLSCIVYSMVQEWPMAGTNFGYTRTWCNVLNVLLFTQNRFRWFGLLKNGQKIFENMLEAWVFTATYSHPRALEVSQPGVSQSFLGHGKMEEMGEMGGNEGKWGKTE